MNQLSTNTDPMQAFRERVLEKLRGDIAGMLPDEALKGLEPTEYVDPFTGELARDYDNIPLKNPDGSLTRYAHNLAEMHAPAVRTEQAFAQEQHAKIEREAMVGPNGVEVAVPAKHARAVADAQGLKPIKRRKA